MSSGKVKCTCGWSWNKSDSSKKDMYICHECGRDNSNNMKNGGWLDSYADGGTMQEHQENYNNPQVSLPEGFVGMGNNTKGRNYSPAWGGQFQMGGQAPKRRGVRYNEDGSVSTHLMKTETDGKGNWFSFPTLFQNSIPYADDSENWLDMSDRPWEEAYEEAKKRGEVINFGSDKDAAIKFGQGSWKDKKQMGGSVYPVNYVPEAQWGLPVGPFTPIAPLALSAANKVKSWFSDDEPVKPIKPIKKPVTKGKPRTLNIVDPRKKMATTNQPLRPNSDLVSGKYNSNHLDKLMQEAKRQGLSKQDMMNLSAMGFQETKWGRSDGNIGHVIGNWKGNDSYQQFISAYKEKMKEADRLGIKDPATRLQVYNGMGTITPKTEKNYHGFEMQKIYGVPIPKGGINMKKNPLYGKQVMDIRDNVLAKNPEYLQYMDSIYKAPVPAYMQDVRMNKQKPPRFIIPPIGTREMGGSIPGAVGFSYARTNDPAPDNGPGAKKTMASAQGGKKVQSKEKKWLGNTLTPEGWVTSTTKGGNYISFTGNQRSDEWINKQIDTGKFGFDPETQTTFPLKKPVKGLSKEDRFMATKQYHDLRAPEGFTNESQQAQIDKLPEWQQDMLNAENTKRRKRVVYNSMQDAVKNPLFYAPGAIALAPIAAAGLTEAGILASPYIESALATQLPGMATVPGATVGNAITAGFAGHGLANVGPDSIEMYENPSWENAFNVAMDVAESLPVVGPTTKTIGEGMSASRRALGSFKNDLVSHARSLGPNRRVATNSFGNEQVSDLVRRLRSNQPLGEMQIGSLGQAYNSGSLSRADSELFTRYLIDRNRVTPGPPGGLFGMTAEETAEQYARMQENPMGWGTERWNVNNQLAPPPSEIRFNIDGSTESIYSARPQPTIPTTLNGIDLRRPINGHAPGTPEWERLNNLIWERQNMIKPTLRNKSGYTKEDLLSQASSKDKDVISKMTEKEFQETVFTPKGEVLNYKPSAEIDQMAYNPVTGGSALKDQIPLSNEEYAKVFNENIDILNDIISKNNTSGVNYSVSELTPSGQLIFNTPAQKVAANRSFADILRTPVDEFRNVVRNEMDLAAGQSSWTVNIKPGQWRGEVENIANPEYYKSIPGLDMSNTSRSVFADNVPRRGTGTYESINEYLKRLDLGRVKPGFNSQTQFSKGLWENAIKKDKAFGFYGNPGTVYGSMKSIAPYLGIGGVGAAAASQTEEEEVPQQKQGGVIKDDMGYWNPDNWGKDVEIDQSDPNSFIDMEGVYEPLLGVSDKGERRIMYPGEKHKFKKGTKKVTESRIAKNGLRQEQKGLVNLDQLTNFTNYNTKQPGGWLDKY